MVWLLLALAVTLPLIVMWFHSSRFLVVSEYAIPDGPSLEAIQPEVTRTIKRDFWGDWQVSLRHRVADGWEPVATTPAQRERYRRDAQLPEPIPMWWWAGHDFAAMDLPKGEYELCTFWTVNADLPFPLRQPVSRCDTFTITGG